MISTVGKDPLWAMCQMATDFAPRLPESFRMRDLELQLFTARLGGRQVAGGPSQHLTAVWGAAAPRIARLAEAIQTALPG